MNVIFLRKENVSESVECVLDRSILEHNPGFLERFFFLKKVKFFFGTRSIPFYSINIFHWVHEDQLTIRELADVFVNFNIDVSKWYTPIDQLFRSLSFLQNMSF
jgi:hypothetical protein